ncbi:MAG: SPOR domain-containing protein [Prevotella sp.]|nr:SPOR domain-containing protein [Prevotella sp.]
MIELARHLEVLLLSNDCVIVPDFGGFVAHYVPARVDEADGMFLPPIRTIGFNPQLKMNDSLLAQSYAETYDISYPEALLRIEQEVEEIRRQVLHDEVYHLEGIGTLTSNDEGNYYFEPQESGLLTPSLYGLGSYEFSLLKPLSSTYQPKPVAEEVQESTDIVEEAETTQLPLIELLDEEEEHAVHIRMSWIRNAVAIAAAIALFFLLTTPVANSNLGSQTMSALQNNIIYKLMPKDSNMAPATPVVKAEPLQNTEAKVEVKADSVKQRELVPPVEEKPYCIVLASQVKRANAEEFVRIMRNRGFNDTEINIHNNVIRVVYGHFKSESAAYVELHNLRFEENFEEAWVYKRKAEG